MATSSKVLFCLEDLKVNALKALDEQIAHTQAIVNNYDADALYSQQVDDWREDQKATILELAAKVKDGTITDVTLEAFKARAKPTRDRWDHERQKTHLHKLQNDRTRMMAKAEALIPDSDGNIALTKTQLSEFFRL